MRGLGEHHALQVFLLGMPYYNDTVEYSGSDRISDCGYSDAVEGGYRHDQHVSR